MSPTNDVGLVVAFQLDGEGGGEAIGWDGIRQWTPDKGFLWVHLDLTVPEARRWMREESGLDEVTTEALLVDDTRPRSVVSREGLLVFLRGVNLNPGADPEDMVGLRLWVNRHRVISLRMRRLLAVDELRAAIARGAGPKTPGEFLSDIAHGLTAHMADVIDGIDQNVDRLAEEIGSRQAYELRQELAAVRRQAVILRRYLAPQRDAITRLQAERVDWLHEVDRLHLRETGDILTRYIEDLDAAGERATVTQEELLSQLSEQVNRRMYRLSVVAALFLPGTFVTGLLGVNVGGIPGGEYKWGFAVVCVFLVAMIAPLLWLLRRKGWL